MKEKSTTFCFHYTQLNIVTGCHKVQRYEQIQRGIRRFKEGSERFLGEKKSSGSIKYKNAHTISSLVTS